MSALATTFAPAPLRYRDVELTALSFAGEVRYHDRAGALAFRISPRENERLARVAATSGRAAVMLFLFLKIVARPGQVMTLEGIAGEVGGVSGREVGKVLARLSLAGLVRRVEGAEGFEIEFVG